MSGESTAALLVNLFLAPAHEHRARGWTGRKHRFLNLRDDPTGNRTKTTRFGRVLNQLLHLVVNGVVYFHNFHQSNEIKRSARRGVYPFNCANCHIPLIIFQQ